ncbi:hypothetical protein A2Z67_06140, partial [Candidatus Woesebacteria bacterium RBG_13_36_22]
MNIDPSIFKAYDIRGIYPKTINEEVAYKIGYAYAIINKPENEVLVGHDVRIHSEKLKKSIIDGLTDAGTDVMDVGWMSTDMLYFGVGNYQTDGGIAVTASHNPPEWHGAKMVKKGVVPMTLESGIGEIRDFIINNKKWTKTQKGKVRNYQDILIDYSKYILTWINPKDIKPFKVVINPNYGYGGLIFKKIIELGHLPIDLIELNSNPDGNFPKGRPDPFIPENRIEFSNLVKLSGANLGITWDADSDRVFFCADYGLFVVPYYLNTILIETMLKKHKSEKIIYDIRYTWGLIEAIKENGGIPVLCRVGHSYIKEKMREENALFAVESSGHTYYKNYWYSDCGMLPPVQVLEFLSNTNKRFSEIVIPIMNKYFICDEINSEVADK